MYDKYDRQEMNLRVLGEYQLLRTDPFGHWIVADSKGKPIKEITSVYTGVAEAKLALEDFLRKQETKNAKRVKHDS